MSHEFVIHEVHMSRFTKEQMRDELRDILLYQADHIACCGAKEAAELFIGFPQMDEEDDIDQSYYEMQPSRVDLNRFSISRYFDLAYDFAFHPSLMHHIEANEVGRLITFMNATPRPVIEDIDNINPLISMRPVSASFMEQDGYCQTVADAALARWKLEISGRGNFTPRELALLANMSEAAVRNAISDKSETALKPIPGSKPVQVEHEEALRWLQGRRGFKAIPKRMEDDIVAKLKLETVHTAQELGRLVRSHYVTFFGGHPFQDNPSNPFAGNYDAYFKLEQMPKGWKSLDWSEDEFKSWQDGTFHFDREKALKLAEAFDLDAPLFVGKALEVSLRRDAVSGGR